ncbi:hypothetical protein GCM10027563_30540 [Parasphingorhabdus pacifica]
MPHGQDLFHGRRQPPSGWDSGWAGGGFSVFFCEDGSDVAYAGTSCRGSRSDQTPGVPLSAHHPNHYRNIPQLAVR